MEIESIGSVLSRVGFTAWKLKPWRPIDGRPQRSSPPPMPQIHGGQTRPVADVRSDLRHAEEDRQTATPRHETAIGKTLVRWQEWAADRVPDRLMLCLGPSSVINLLASLYKEIAAA